MPTFEQPRSRPPRGSSPVGCGPTTGTCCRPQVGQSCVCRRFANSVVNGERSARDASSLTSLRESPIKLWMIVRSGSEQLAPPAGDPEDREPEVLGSDEASTPQWLPWVGLAVALVLASWFLATHRVERAQAEQSRAGEPMVPPGQVVAPAVEPPGAKPPPGRPAGRPRLGSAE
jgi:hypothetical protein